MSTTDIRAAFEAAYLSLNGFHTKAELAREWMTGHLSSEMFRAGYQAATEAAKATGTAGELLGSLHEDIMNIPVSLDLCIPSDASQMLAYKMGHRDARHAAAELAANAEAARQPAPVALSDDQINDLWNALPGIEIHNKAYAQGMATDYALRIAFAKAIIAATNRSQP